MEKYFLGYNKSENFGIKFKKLIKEKKLMELIIRGTIFIKGRILREKVLYFLFKIFNRNKKFIFNGKKYNYLITNKTFFNERMMEIPIFKEILLKNKDKNILEVGNVMKNFMPTNHEVIDKYELGEGIINKDIVNFNPKKKYDLIISISTLEHIGWDEVPIEPMKILKAIEKLQKITKKDGDIIFSIPWNYNHALDRLISDEEIKITEKYFFKRNRNNKWIQTDWERLRKTKFNKSIPRANGIIIGIIKN